MIQFEAMYIATIRVNERELKCGFPIMFFFSPIHSKYGNVNFFSKLSYRACILAVIVKSESFYFRFFFSRVL